MFQIAIRAALILLAAMSVFAAWANAGRRYTECNRIAWILAQVAFWLLMAALVVAGLTYGGGS